MMRAMMRAPSPMRQASPARGISTDYCPTSDANFDEEPCLAHLGPSDSAADPPANQVWRQVSASPLRQREEALPAKTAPVFPAPLFAWNVGLRPASINFDQELKKPLDNMQREVSVMTTASSTDTAPPTVAVQSAATTSSSATPHAVSVPSDTPPTGYVTVALQSAGTAAPATNAMPRGRFRCKQPGRLNAAEGALDASGKRLNAAEIDVLLSARAEASGSSLAVSEPRQNWMTGATPPPSARGPRMSGVLQTQKVVAASAPSEASTCADVTENLTQSASVETPASVVSTHLRAASLSLQSPRDAHRDIATPRASQVACASPQAVHRDPLPSFAAPAGEYEIHVATSLSSKPAISSYVAPGLANLLESDIPRFTSAGNTVTRRSSLPSRSVPFAVNQPVVAQRVASPPRTSLPSSALPFAAKQEMHAERGATPARILPSGSLLQKCRQQLVQDVHAPSADVPAALPRTPRRSDGRESSAYRCGTPRRYAFDELPNSRVASPVRYASPIRASDGDVICASPPRGSVRGGSMPSTLRSDFSRERLHVIRCASPSRGEMPSENHQDVRCASPVRNTSLERPVLVAPCPSPAQRDLLGTPVLLSRGASPVRRVLPNNSPPASARLPAPSSSQSSSLRMPAPSSSPPASARFSAREVQVGKVLQHEPKMEWMLPEASDPYLPPASQRVPIPSNDSSRAPPTSALAEGQFFDKAAQIKAALDRSKAQRVGHEKARPVHPLSSPRVSTGHLRNVASPELPPRTLIVEEYNRQRGIQILPAVELKSPAMENRSVALAPPMSHRGAPNAMRSARSDAHESVRIMARSNTHQDSVEVRPHLVQSNMDSVESRPHLAQPNKAHVPKGSYGAGPCVLESGKLMPSSGPSSSVADKTPRLARPEVQNGIDKSVHADLKLIVFDFDCTLTVTHVFSSLAGSKHTSTPVPHPHARSERGQLARVCELEEDPAWGPGVFSNRVFGGVARVLNLHRMLKLIQSSGVECVVCSRGLIGPVRKCLDQAKLLPFFSQTYGNLGAPFGTLEYDIDVLAPEGSLGYDECFLGTADMQVGISKADTLKQLIHERQLESQQVVFVDDDIGETNSMHNLCCTIHVNHGNGFGDREMNAIYRMLDGKSDAARAKAGYVR